MKRVAISLGSIMTALSIAAPVAMADTQHTVQSGETLWKIAQRFQTTTSILENLNPLINPDILYPGEVIQIPSTVVANPASTTSSNSSTASSNSTASSTNSAPSKASAIIATAKGFLGTPYVWGGTAPSGFDCSGFVQYVYGQNGVTLPRTSTEQSTVGTSITQAALQPGDLVFFADTWKAGVSHVGIYLGNRQFIEESSGKGQVIITSLDNPYYAAHYAGARRVL
ncbi:NlpC/P60 family protein [Alicyclobacillus dauci]|uniref:NlpC/P60 family protein n=1 Tax=Alicyclobacillus dauci TaxID=1475485 RepID=A0ABY6Z8Y1_9BACL|nr:NlpC/P60 family protein [Alicyclobacillus dauci]WAH39327.1 NlpC/P60 family protein [Alicyclobacillus dauci]